MRDGTDITGATGLTYILTGADVGTFITVRVAVFPWLASTATAPVDE
jgi:hypothetical protein